MSDLAREAPRSSPRSTDHEEPSSARRPAATRASAAGRRTSQGEASPKSESNPPLPYRMKDLCDKSGLPRQAIHFYIQQGLLPAGVKTGRNMAYYGERHLERLRLIRKLQHERFLPLKAIKAMLEGREDEFSPTQEVFLRDVKTELQTSLGGSSRSEESRIDVTDQLERVGVSLQEVKRMASTGLLSATIDGKSVYMSADDVWVIDNFSQIRAAGFTEELGFGVDDMAFFVDAIDMMFKRETQILRERLSALPPQDVARMIERALPIVHDFLVRQHAARVRDFFTAIDDEQDNIPPKKAPLD